MDKPSHQKLEKKIQELESESLRLQQIKKELLEKQKILRNQNINLVKKSIELSDIKRELEDKNYELELTRSQLRSENVRIVRKSIELSDIMRELEDKNYDLEISQSELKAAITALQESERKYSELVQESPDPIVSLDHKGNFLSFNPMAEHLSGFKWEEVLGKQFSKVNILSKESIPNALKEFEKVLSGIERPPFELTILCKDKSLLYVEANPRRIMQQEKKPLVQVIFRDITKRKKMEQELLKSQKLESLSFLAGGIAHDFNNILAAIMGYNSLAKQYIGDKTRVLNKLNEVEKAVSLAKGLTQQLLTFSRGGAPIKRHTSIGELLRDTVEFTSRGSNVNCKYSIPEDLWSVEIDEGQISQVIQNLIINSKQASKEGGTIRVQVKNADIGPTQGLPLKEGRYVNIMVKDHGIGMTQNHLNKIFDPFFTTKQKGVGLGLSTAYSIIKNHNGLIMAESELGKGTVFSVYLPASGKKTVKKKEKSQKMVMGQGKILLMDDEDMILESMGELLRDIGYTIVTAKDGTEAIKEFKKAKKSGQPFDVVILDLIVPGGMSGEQTIKELLKIEPKVKAIVSSGYSTYPIMADYKAYGFVGAISKPYKPKEMSAMLQKIITGSDK